MFAFLAFTWVEICLSAGFLIALAVATAFDRNHNNAGPKWAVTGIAFAVFVAHQMWGGSASQVNTWAYWKTLTPYVNIGYYILIGFGYAVIETFYELLSRRKEIAFAWSLSLANADENVKRYMRGQSFVPDERDVGLPPEEQQRLAKRRSEDFVCRFCTDYDKYGSILRLVYSKDVSVPQPRINVEALTEWMLAWTFFWPGYSLSLVFGRLIDAFWAAAIEFFATFLQRITNAVFRNTFKTN